MKRTTFLLAAALAMGVLFGPGAARADGPGAFAGVWLNLTLSDGQVADRRCRYLDVETDRLDLSRAPDGAVAGSYTRERGRTWLIKMDPACRMPGQQFMPDGFGRIDQWSLYGSVAGNRLPLSAVYLDCIGDCSDNAALRGQFETVLTRQGGSVVAAGGDHPDDIRVFLPGKEHEDAAGHASESLRKLLQPLMEGNCSRYFAEALDPGARMLLPYSQDVFCKAIEPIGALLQPFSVDKPAFAYGVTVGSVAPAAGDLTRQRMLLARDVVVQRFFTTIDGSAGLHVTAVLRRQPNGSWKIRQLL